MTHPLFPNLEDDQEVQVGYIHVTRFESGGTVYAPKLFKAEELQDLDTIVQLYGGGKYELIGRDLKGQRVVTRQTYTLPGKPKPLGPEENEPDPKPPVSQTPTPDVANMNPMALMMPIMMQMMQMQAAQATNMHQSTMQMITALIAKSSDGANQHVATMQSLHDRHAADQAAMYQTILAAKGNNGGGSPGDFMKGVEFMKKFVENNVPAEAQQDESFMSTLAQIMQGAQMFMGGPNGGGMTPDMMAAMFGGVPQQTPPKEPSDAEG
jgi:hypothetical protein